MIHIFISGCGLSSMTYLPEELPKRMIGPPNDDNNIEIRNQCSTFNLAQVLGTRLDPLSPIALESEIAHMSTRSLPGPPLSGSGPTATAGSPSKLAFPYLSSLNPAQHSAVISPPSTPLQILAGPGSGKTRVLTSRVAYLVQRHGYKPYEIVAVTFTNKAASEMRKRLRVLLGEKQADNLVLGEHLDWLFDRCERERADSGDRADDRHVPRHVCQVPAAVRETYFSS